MSRTLKISFVLLLGAMFATLFILMQKPWQVYGSVTVGNEYSATSTGSTDFTNYRVIQAKSPLNPAGTRIATGTPTTLGSVVITAPGGRFCLYDATSTVSNGEWATTTIACFGASVAAGTYTFDAPFEKGLLLEQQANPAQSSWASSTIMFR